MIKALVELSKTERIWQFQLVAGSLFARIKFRSLRVFCDFMYIAKCMSVKRQFLLRIQFVSGNLFARNACHVSKNCRNIATSRCPGAVASELATWWCYIVASSNLVCSTPCGQIKSAISLRHVAFREVRLRAIGARKACWCKRGVSVSLGSGMIRGACEACGYIVVSHRAVKCPVPWHHLRDER